MPEYKARIDMVIHTSMRRLATVTLPAYKFIDSQIPEMLFRSSLVYKKGLGAKLIPERKRVEGRWMTYTHIHLCTCISL